MGVTDNTWHHVCVLLDNKIGLVTVFKDGHRSFKERRDKAPNFVLWTAGNNNKTNYSRRWKEFKEKQNKRNKGRQKEKREKKGNTYFKLIGYIN